MGKIGSTILTFLFSIPVTAVGWMAIFGVPPIAALNASPSGNDIVIRDPYAQDAPPFEGNQQGDLQQYGSESNAPINRPPLYFGDSPSSSDSNSSGNHLAHNPEHSQPSSRGRQFPNQPMNANDTRVALGTGTSVLPRSNPSNTPSTGRHNPFETGNNSIRTNTTETSAQMLTWQEASARLTELGIKKYHLERGGNEGMFMFVCLYHPSDTPQVTHRFEAEGNDPLVAVNQVLNQVDGWLQQQYRESHSHTGGSQIH